MDIDAQPQIVDKLEAPQRITPITGEELQVKFLSDSGENALKH
jgi:hypothetical protein